MSGRAPAWLGVAALGLGVVAVLGTTAALRARIYTVVAQAKVDGAARAEDLAATGPVRARLAARSGLDLALVDARARLRRGEEPAPHVEEVLAEWAMGSHQLFRARLVDREGDVLLLEVVGEVWAGAGYDQPANLLASAKLVARARVTRDRIELLESRVAEESISTR